MVVNVVGGGVAELELGAERGGDVGGGRAVAAAIRVDEVIVVGQHFGRVQHHEVDDGRVCDRVVADKVHGTAVVQLVDRDGGGVRLVSGRRRDGRVPGIIVMVVPVVLLVAVIVVTGHHQRIDHVLQRVMHRCCAGFRLDHGNRVVLLLLVMVVVTGRQLLLLLL